MIGQLWGLTGRSAAVGIDRTTAVVHVTTGICVMEVSVQE